MAGVPGHPHLQFDLFDALGFDVAATRATVGLITRRQIHEAWQRVKTHLHPRAAAHNNGIVPAFPTYRQARHAYHYLTAHDHENQDAEAIRRIGQYVLRGWPAFRSTWNPTAAVGTPAVLLPIPGAPNVATHGPAPPLATGSVLPTPPITPANKPLLPAQPPVLANHYPHGPPPQGANPPVVLPVAVNPPVVPPVAVNPPVVPPVVVNPPVIPPVVVNPPVFPLVVVHPPVVPPAVLNPPAVPPVVVNPPVVPPVVVNPPVAPPVVVNPPVVPPAVANPPAARMPGRHVGGEGRRPLTYNALRGLTGSGRVVVGDTRVGSRDFAVEGHLTSNGALNLHRLDYDVTGTRRFRHEPGSSAILFENLRLVGPFRECRNDRHKLKRYVTNERNP